MTWYAFKNNIIKKIFTEELTNDKLERVTLSDFNFVHENIPFQLCNFS